MIFLCNQGKLQFFFKTTYIDTEGVQINRVYGKWFVENWKCFLHLPWLSESNKNPATTFVDLKKTLIDEPGKLHYKFKILNVWSINYTIELRK